MEILVVLGHPEPGSFNHALAQAAAEALTALGHTVTYHDLCAEGFDPALPGPEIPKDGPVDQAVARHCAELARADGVVVVHPNWWGMPPAVLKGWVDRVFRPGVAYEFVEGDGGEGVPRGLLRARAAVVFNTGNTPPQRERDSFGDPLERLWRDCVFGLCGVADVRRRLFGVVCVSTADQRAAWLSEARALVAEAFPSEGA